LNTVPEPENSSIETGGVNGINPPVELSHRAILSPDFTAPKHEKKCPHCNHALTLKEAIIILNGSGYVEMAKIKLRNGSLAVMDAGRVNPNAVEIID
jgi:hypothetical protein